MNTYIFPLECPKYFNSACNTIVNMYFSCCLMVLMGKRKMAMVLFCQFYCFNVIKLWHLVATWSCPISNALSQRSAFMCMLSMAGTREEKERGRRGERQRLSFSQDLTPKVFISQVQIWIDLMAHWSYSQEMSMQRDPPFGSWQVKDVNMCVIPLDSWNTSEGRKQGLNKFHSPVPFTWAYLFTVYDDAREKKRICSHLFLKCQFTDSKVRRGFPSKM